MTTIERIRSAQTRLDLTHDQMAAYVGVSPHTLRKWLSGERLPGAQVDRMMDILSAVECMAPDMHSALLPK